MKRRLSILAFLTACLITLTAVPAKSTTIWFCERRVNDETCVWFCCSDWDCWESPC